METSMDQAKCKISFNYKYGQVRIHNHVLRILKQPKFIQFLIQPDEKMLYIQGQDVREHDSFPIPEQEILDRRHGFVLYGQGFILRICELVGWELNKTHLVQGRYNSELDVVEFDLSNEIIK